MSGLIRFQQDGVSFKQYKRRQGKIYELKMGDTGYDYRISVSYGVRDASVAAGG